MFPSVIVVGSASQTSNTQQHTLPVSLAGVSSGDLLVAIIATDGNPSFTWPTSWVSLFATANGTIVTLAAAWHQYIGTDAATIITSTSASEQSATKVLAIRDWHETTAPEAGTAATGASANPNPPSLNPANWDVEDTLWIACHGVDTARTTSTYPNSFANNQQTHVAAGTQGVGIAVCTHNYALSSTDPGSFVVSASDDWVAQTLAIRPANPVLRGPIDYLFVNDGSSQKDYDVKVTNYPVQLAEKRLSDRSSIQRDNLLLADRSYRDLSRMLRDMMFLYDASSADFSGGTPGQTITRDLSDGLYMLDRVYRAQDILSLDKLLIFDASNRLTEKINLDKLLTEETRYSSIDRLATDKILINDLRRSERDSTSLDKLLVGDNKFRAIDRAISDALLLLDRAYRDQTLVSQDRMLLLDRAYRDLSKHVIDKLFLYHHQTPQSTVFEDVSVVDGLLLKDLSTRDLARAFLDKLLLGDSSAALQTGQVINLVSAADQILLGDQSTKDFSKTILDKLFLRDGFVLDLSRVFLDKILLLDRQVLDRSVRLLDNLFLFNTPSGGASTYYDYTIGDELFLYDGLVQEGIKTRFSSDGLYLSDQSLRDRFAQIRDFILLKDESFRDQAKQLVDGVLLRDYVIRESLRYALDNLLINETSQREIALRLYDRLFLYDSYLREILGAGNIFERSATDSLFLRDESIRDIAKILTDKTLLGDQGFRVLSMVRSLIDGAYLSDAAMRASEKRSADGLLLDDQSRKDLAKTIADGLLLRDQSARERVMAIIEGLFLYDSKIVEYIGAGGQLYALSITDYLFAKDEVIKDLARTVQADKLLMGDSVARLLERIRIAIDGLLMRDQSIRTSEHRLSEGALLSDERRSELARLVQMDKILLGESALPMIERTRFILDQILLVDARFRGRDLTAQDTVLLHDATLKILEKIIHDGVIFYDTKATPIYPYIVEYITWAKTRMVDIFSARNAVVNIAGLVSRIERFFGIFSDVTRRDTGMIDDGV